MEIHDLNNLGENTDNPEGQKKRPRVVIIGHVGHGTTTSIALAERMLGKEISKGEIVIANSVEEASEMTGVDVSEFAQAEKVNPFEREPMRIKIDRIEEPLPNNIDYMRFDAKVNNPWPSPKERKGKRRY